MNQPYLFGCVFGIIRNEEGEVLFQKRSNTGYADGFFQIPAGHMLPEESMHDAIKRKMKLELNIEITKFDVSHIAHRVRQGKKEGFDVYFEIHKYEGTIKNNEPEKCEYIEFKDISLQTPEMIGFDINVINMIGNNIAFSEEII